MQIVKLAHRPILRFSLCILGCLIGETMPMGTAGRSVERCTDQENGCACQSASNGLPSIQPASQCGRHIHSPCPSLQIVPRKFLSYLPGS
ncbi:hypothetical protein BKA64DRAFT_666777 [Cadophora sp. MPI-SDFR-AT-0126]|nr:hypothetical protein BKA64DRAFT_666777 [Leotiomycetes sp. MPI-SDFR-AT-0126]